MATTRTAFGKFCYINGLKNKDLAEYLGTTSQYVSLLRRGEKVPGRIYDLLVNNKNGWDASPLTEEIKTFTEPSDPNAILSAQLQEKDRQIARLQEIIQNLTKR